MGIAAVFDSVGTIEVFDHLSIAKVVSDLRSTVDKE